jgi:hypothetical protein
MGVMRSEKKQLWLGWTAANSLAELACLEATYAVFYFITSTIHPTHISGLQVYAVIAVISAIIEASTVGLAQAWVLRVVFPTIRRIAWWGATLLGTLLAYALGWWPINQIMAFLEDNPPYRTVMYRPFLSDPLLLLILLGAATGAVISFAQWLVLRGEVSRAWKWIEGNALAWACGFPLILGGLVLASDLSTTWQVRLATAEVLLVIGLLVATINGWYLARLTGERTPPHFIRSIQDKLNAIWENLS